MKPVLYLDLDDTILVWRTGHVSAAPGARNFLRWALSHYDVRWLTLWCPGGEMPQGLLGDLARMLRMEEEELAGVTGVDYSGGSKLDGVAWSEHVLGGRPFVWLENEISLRQRQWLDANGFWSSFWHVDVTADPSSLARLHAALEAGDRSLWPVASPSATYTAVQRSQSGEERPVGGCAREFACAFCSGLLLERARQFSLEVGRCCAGCGAAVVRHEFL